MEITGRTSHKLDKIRTYDPDRPYNTTRDYFDGDVRVLEYTIEGIEYVTRLEDLRDPTDPNNKAIDFNRSVSQYVPPSINQLGSGSGLTDYYPTTFKYTVNGNTSTNPDDNYFGFKDEVKIGVVFEPKILEDVFIERQVMTVFESQSRFGVIQTLEDLEEYNNGYYNVIKTE
tara:strand:+ start:31 stop:546 length:516 start_codon:yes stop_codon:yes gene_type:complete